MAGSRRVRQPENFSGGTVWIDFKLIGGGDDYSAGLAFGHRGTSYYYVRYNTKDGNVALWRMDGPVRTVIKHGEAHAQLPKGEWHRLHLRLDGRNVRASVGHLTVEHELDEPVSGRLGLWTKPDATEATITGRARMPLQPRRSSGLVGMWEEDACGPVAKPGRRNNEANSVPRRECPCSCWSLAEESALPSPPVPSAAGAPDLPRFHSPRLHAFPLQVRGCGWECARPFVLLDDSCFMPHGHMECRTRSGKKKGSQACPLRAFLTEEESASSAVLAADALPSDTGHSTEQNSARAAHSARRVPAFEAETVRKQA